MFCKELCAAVIEESCAVNKELYALNKEPCAVNKEPCAVNDCKKILELWRCLGNIF